MRFLHLVLLIVLLFSCKEDKTCIVLCDSVAEVDPEAQEIFLQDTGSRIEYELLDSNIVDTIVLTSNRKWYSVNKCLDPDIYCQYVYDLEFDHSNTEYYPKSNYRGSSVSREIYQLLPFGDRWAVLLTNANETSSTNGHIFSFPVHQGEKSGNDYMVSDTSRDISTAIGFIRTIEVVKTIPPSNSRPFDFKSFNYARGVGLVRFEMYNGHIWQIKSYNIK